jgi:D-sedoheptulose 7-phosphate isomerase
MMEQEIDAYLIDLAARIPYSDTATLAAVGENLLRLKAKGGTVFLAGNGGSAATASHVTNDLVKGCRVNGQNGFKAICLGDSSTLVTCLANDFSYADIYSILLKTYAKHGDALIVFSGSGKSPNIIEALKAARQIGITTIGFGGRDGGDMKPLCDLCVIAPTDSMEMLEDFHLIYWHDLVCTMRTRLGGKACGC